LAQGVKYRVSLTTIIDLSFFTSKARANYLLSYFLGFREGHEGKPTTRPLDELKWMLMYHLVIAPKREGRGSCLDVDTSRWRF